MTELKIDDIEVFPVKPLQGLIAFISFIVNDSLYIGNVALHTRPDGSDFRLVFPTVTLPNGKVISCAHPITKRASDTIKQEVVTAYQKLTQKIQNDVITENQKCGGKVYATREPSQRLL